MCLCQCRFFSKRTVLLIALAFLIAVLAQKTAAWRIEYGLASWYQGSPSDCTCASWDYPIGSLVKITNLSNQKEVICRVAERGPDRSLGRSIDLSEAAFNQIADTREGILRVRIRRVLV